MVRSLRVILLNELSDTPNNAVFKCFYTKQRLRNVSLQCCVLRALGRATRNSRPFKIKLRRIDILTRCVKPLCVVMGLRGLVLIDLFWGGSG